MLKGLNIVALDIPFPADYGGVIDIYYRIRELSVQGVEIHLHCFYSSRKPAPGLQKYCKSVNYYRRSFSPLTFFGKKPFIVASRHSSKLLKNLLANDHPVLFEGLHTTSFLCSEALSGRKKIVRTHNIEHNYYRNQNRIERNILMKIFFMTESIRLRNYEKILACADLILAVKDSDRDYFKRYAPTVTIHPFHPPDKAMVPGDKGEGILFHGNLSVPENREAALFLIGNVFSKTEKPAIIAGKKPGRRIKKAAAMYDNISLIEDPTDEKMTEIIRKAQINIVISNSPTGVKLKLINTLLNGRHCIANSNIISGTGLERLCEPAESPAEILSLIDRLYDINFCEDNERVEQRNSVLSNLYSNETSAKRIIQYAGSDDSFTDH